VACVLSPTLFSTSDITTYSVQTETPRPQEELSILLEIQKPVLQDGDHFHDHSQWVHPATPPLTSAYQDNALICLVRPDANIQCASDSIFDILGYRPDEVVGKSCFDYFHPDEVPFARYQHNRGVQLEKAAVLHYARIKNRDGDWVGCECVFTVTYDVLVACTSIYRENEKSGRKQVRFIDWYDC